MTCPRCGAPALYHAGQVLCRLCDATPAAEPAAVAPPPDPAAYKCRYLPGPRPNVRRSRPAPPSPTLPAPAAIAAIVLGVAALAALVTCSGALLRPRTPAEQAAAAERALESRAGAEARRIVRERLRYPHDASFSWDQETRPLQGGGYRVRGQVTAPNGLGLPVTEEYWVEFRVEGRGEEARLRAIYVRVGEREG